MSESTIHSPEPTAVDQLSDEVVVSDRRDRGMKAAMARSWGVVLVIGLIGAMLSFFYVTTQEKLHRSRVQIQFMPVDSGPLFAKSSSTTNPRWTDTEYEILKSRETLMHVVRQKGLSRRWNFGNDDNGAADALAKKVEIHHEAGSDMVTIEIYSSKMEEAAELANAIADAYEERTKDWIKGRNEGAINMLQMEIDSQEKKTEEKRVAMLTIMKKYAIVDFPTETKTGANDAPVENGDRQVFLNQKTRVAEYEAEALKLEAQLKALRAEQDQDQLLELAAGMNLDSPTIKDALPKFRQAKLELTKLLEGGADGAAGAVLAAKGRVEALQSELATAVEGLKRTLSTKVEICQSALKSAQQSLATQNEEMVSSMARQSEYSMAKREYQQQLALLSEMREHILRQKVDLEMPIIPARRHENAFPSPEVIRPNGELILAAGTSIALMLGLALAFILEYCRKD